MKTKLDELFDELENAYIEYASQKSIYENLLCARDTIYSRLYENAQGENKHNQILTSKEYTDHITAICMTRVEMIKNQHRVDFLKFKIKHSNKPPINVF